VSRTAASSQRIEPEVLRAGVVITLGAVGSIVTLNSIHVAFPVIARQLGAPIDTVQWIATGYLLGMASAIPASGWLSRRVGARRLYLLAVASFVAASVLCSLAATIEQLIAARAVQGAAGGVMLPVGQIILVSVAGPEQLSRVMSIVGAPMLLGPLLAPAIGGLLLDEVSWQSIFLLNVPLGLAVLVLGVRRLPRLEPEPAGSFDRYGFVLGVLGGSTVVYGLAAAGRTGSIGAPGAAVPTLAGLALIVLFVVHARRREQPLLDMRLWRNRRFAACATSALLVSALLLGSMTVFALYLQIARGETATATGLLLAPQGIGGMISIIVAGRLADRVGGGPVACVGIAVVTAVTLLLAVAADELPNWALCALLAVRGLGTGAAAIPTLATAYTTLNLREVSDATPQVALLQRLGGALGVALLAAVLAKGLGEADVEGAFETAFGWGAGLGALALIPAIVLLRIERRAPEGVA
jgi:EmrB/QacA subfamily drug resistance transporter